MNKLLFILSFLLTSTSAQAGSPTLWGSPYSKNLESGICLNGNACVVSGALNPTDVAVNAPEGSIYLSANGNLYIKQDSGNSTNWLSAGGASPGAPDQSIQYGNGSSLAATLLTSPDNGLSFGSPGFGFGSLLNQTGNSDAISGNTWIPAHGGVTGGGPDPMGGTSGATITFAAYGIDGPYDIGGSSFASQQITMSMWLKGSAGGEQLWFGSINNLYSFTTGTIDTFCSSPVTLTTSWARYSCTFTPTSASLAVGIFAKSSSYTVYGYGIQVTPGTAIGIYTATGNGGSVGPSYGITAQTGNFKTLQVHGNIYADRYSTISNLRPQQLSGVGCVSTDSIYYDTADNWLAYCDNSQASHQIATVGGGGSGHGVDSVGTFSMSGSYGYIYDSAITYSSIITFSINSPNNPCMYQVSPSSGSAYVNPYYNSGGFGGTCYNDYSTVNYVVQH